MIGRSNLEYLFIRACILFLHNIAPICTAYCIVVLVLQLWPVHTPLAIAIWVLAESAYLLLWYYPASFIIQRAAKHPPTRSREQRRALFSLCKDTIQDPDRYLRLWFKNAPLSEIRVDNLKQFFCWAFLDKASWDSRDEAELNEYIGQTEILLGRKLLPGRGNAVPLLISLDNVQTLHRSLFWYACVFVVDSLTSVKLLLHGFNLYCQWRSFLSVFPLRPLALFSRRTSPAKRLTYWYRPHISKSRRPILFVHGIGIGLYPYTNFLSEINSNYEVLDNGPEVGIIAIEIMPISFRLTGPPMEPSEICGEMLKILQYHGWSEVLLVSHSFGSVVSTHLLRDPATSAMIGPVLLIDPVSILLHLPDVAYNFTFRKPKGANEWQLYYFASMDPGVAHTLGRSFFWSENIFWKDDMKGRQVTVAMSERDLIVDTQAVGCYLAGAEGNWKTRKWRGKDIDLLWFPGLDHAQVFDSKTNRKILTDVVRQYSKC